MSCLRCVRSRLSVLLLCIATSQPTILDLSHFDTLIVLGTPANPDGSASPEQRERTLEGVREYKAGVASHLIMTGGAAHNQFVEADVMKELAVAQGVPADAITEEGQAQNTIQNIYYSEKIMAAQHWTSAEVVSSPSHLPRAALILAHYSFFVANLMRRRGLVSIRRCKGHCAIAWRRSTALDYGCWVFPQRPICREHA